MTVKQITSQYADKNIRKLIPVTIRCTLINQSINQYRKCLHWDVASTVQIITVHKIDISDLFSDRV